VFFYALIQEIKEVSIWTVVMVKVEVHIAMDLDLDYLGVYNYAYI